MDATWPTLSTGETLSERVHDAVREKILNGELKARAFVRESELATAMGVSRTPIREALARLAGDGFLERIPQRGYRVPEPSIDDLLERYPLLCAVEVLAGELAFPRLGPEEFEQLEAVNQKYRLASERGDVETCIDSNDRFHHLLAVFSGNSVVRDLADDLRSQVRRLEIWEFSRVFEDRFTSGATEWQNAPMEHEAMLDAVRRGDFDEARDILRSNRSSTWRALSRRTALKPRSPDEDHA